MLFILNAYILSFHLYFISCAFCLELSDYMMRYPKVLILSTKVYAGTNQCICCLRKSKWNIYLLGSATELGAREYY